jgi:ribonuclease Y
MALGTTIALAAGAAVLGVAVGYVLRKKSVGAKGGDNVEQKIESKLAAAKAKVESLREEAKREASKIREQAERELTSRRDQLVDLEKRVADREESLASKLDSLEKREEAAKQTQSISEKAAEELKRLRAEEEKKLAEIAGLTQEAAAERAVALAEERTKEDILRRVRKLEKEGEKQLQDKGREILAAIIQRYGASQVSETVSSHVSVQDESMIGRIIGKEGRNIQHLERVTGCEIVIDEVPNSITISCFSPLRRQVAKTALERLIKDGRIHPGRIEGIVEDAKKQINEDIRAAGEAAVFELGILDFPEKLVQLVGRLKYRTSYSQNMLAHSVEVAHIARMLAEELGADVEITKKAALLHDIGKAIDHDVEGTHVELGDKIMKKFGLDQRIVDAANPHDEGYQVRSVEAVIVQVADAVSAARPGARRESLEQYVKRMTDLENIATS